MREHSIPELAAVSEAHFFETFTKNEKYITSLTGMTQWRVLPDEL